jgi:hypothetical protein
MDTMLLVVTVVALTVAAVSTTVAWRVTRAERRRREARVAALAVAAGVPDVPFTAEPSPVAETPSAVAPAVGLPEGGVALADRFLAADNSGSGSAGRQQWLLGGATFAAALVVSLGINPTAGRAVDKLEAEVRVFDPAGILIATRTALVDYLELAPGQESPFVVALGEATTAARYRVSFRTAGTMRPHVDQRINTPASVDRTAEAR